jgi:phage tail sheath gpL-like
MALSNAVDANAISRTLGYALDFRDTQTAAAGVMPVRIAVLSTTQETTAPAKIMDATKQEVLEQLGNCDAVEMLDIIKKNANVTVDVIVVSMDANGEPSADFTSEYLANAFGDVWYSIVVNPFGRNAKVYEILAELNGKPSENGGTGRWNAQIVKPFIAISGTSQSCITTLESPTGRPAEDLTNVLGTAPNSSNTDAEIAAAYAALFAEQSRSKPQLDIAGKKLPVLKLGEIGEIGEMANYNKRDTLLKAGVCTVTYDMQLQGYVVQDFVTFRRMPDQSQKARDWNYCRNIMLDFNIAYNYQILQARTLLGKVIVKDDEVISASTSSDVIRLSVWKAAVVNFFTQMIALAYITDQEYCNENLFVELSGTNPKRINTQFAYKRTETVGIASTTAFAGFSFGEE